MQLHKTSVTVRLGVGVERCDYRTPEYCYIPIITVLHCRKWYNLMALIKTELSFFRLVMVSMLMSAKKKNSLTGNYILK